MAPAEIRIWSDTVARRNEKKQTLKMRVTDRQADIEIKSMSIYEGSIDKISGKTIRAMLNRSYHIVDINVARIPLSLKGLNENTIFDFCLFYQTV